MRGTVFFIQHVILDLVARTLHCKFDTIVEHRVCGGVQFVRLHVSTCKTFAVLNSEASVLLSGTVDICDIHVARNIVIQLRHYVRVINRGI